MAALHQELFSTWMCVRLENYFQTTAHKMTSSEEPGKQLMLKKHPFVYPQNIAQMLSCYYRNAYSW